MWGRYGRFHGPWLAGVVACASTGLTGCGTDDAPADPVTLEPWFTEITSEAGLAFVHESGGTGDFLMPEIMGAGSALFDADGDGLLDVYLTNGTLDPASGGASAGLRNRLYRQEPGGRFTDVSEASGLDDPGYGMGMAIGDVDNDGDADVYVTNFGPDRLYLNQGDGSFVATDRAGIDVSGWSCSAVFFDYDRDGLLDLFVTQYVAFDPAKKCFDSAGRRDYCGPKSFPPVPDVLLHNTGDGSFTDVSAASGITSIAAAGLGVVSDDFNGDGWPDLYVANDAYANHLWTNRGDGTFRDDAIGLGVAFNLHGQAEAGMGLAVADVDGRGGPDLVVTHLGQESNTLYRNLGASKGFFDATGASGLGASSMPWTGFGTVAFDADLDDDLDLAVANGRVVRGTPLDGAMAKAPWDMFVEPNLFYVNDGAGVFTPAADLGGSFCRRFEITRGLAMGDIDGDGDVDLLLANVQGPARVFRNDAPRRGHWIIVRVIDPALARDAIGARITVVCGQRRFDRTITRGGSYLASSDVRAHVGLGPCESVDRIEVAWPDGSRERFTVPGVDRVVTLSRGSGASEAAGQ